MERLVTRMKHFNIKFSVVHGEYIINWDSHPLTEAEIEFIEFHEKLHIKLYAKHLEQKLHCRGKASNNN